MASNFSANQFNRAFSAKSLCNWEVPHYYPEHPRRRTQTTKFIANERGHLLDHVRRPKSSPWGSFKNTWQLPKVITREYANQLSAPPVGNSRWNLPSSGKIDSKLKTIKQEPVCEPAEPIRTESSELMRSITPAEKEVDKSQPKCEKIFDEKEKLNNPIAIAKNGRRAIRHETLERDNDPH